jgi:DNA repair exonuclease SbcCD ATPase subunit
MNEHLKLYDDDISAVKSELGLVDTELNNINKLYQIDIQEKTKLINIQENYTKVINEILEINDLLEKFSADKQTIELNIRDTNEHLNVVQSLITLAKREFRSALLVNVVAYMDKKAKEYAKDVFGSESISIVVDENYIDVIFNNKYYEALSGGEKQKVDIIIQLALRDLLSNQLNIHSNILVLDEGLDFLDSKGSEAVLNLIQNRLNDVESVFIISHHVEELNISYDTEIVVEKGSDGISSISIH